MPALSIGVELMLVLVALMLGVVVGTASVTAYLVGERRGRVAGFSNGFARGTVATVEALRQAGFPISIDSEAPSLDADDKPN